MLVAAGTISCISCTSFGPNSKDSLVVPVRLPPGRARLATRPSATGSPPTEKTMGIVVVAALAASVGGVLSRDHVHLAADQIGRPWPAIDRSCPRPSGPRSRRPGPRHNRPSQGPASPWPTRSARTCRAHRLIGSRSPAVAAAGRGRRAELHVLVASDARAIDAAFAAGSYKHSGLHFDQRCEQRGNRFHLCNGSRCKNDPLVEPSSAT